MLIRELEQKSGLDRATIRYYEKEGFITPLRQDNGYREYSNEDLQQLMKIRLLRQLGMSLETIKGLRQGTEDFHAALAACIKSLDEQVMNADRAKAVCTALYKENTSYSSLSPTAYLQLLNKPELQTATNQTKPALHNSFSEPVYRPYHPVRRFLARMTDYALVKVLVIFLLVVVLRIRPLGSFWSNALTFVIPFFMVRVEAIMLHWWGTTPGKWLYGLSVRTENGDTLSYYDALEREKLVLQEGFGYGIPLWSVYRLYKSYMYYGDVDLDWDRESEYQYHRWGVKKISVLVVAIILIVGMNLWSSLDMIKPTHRGDLSIAQFAENYNYYMKMLNEDAGSTSLLQPDGKHNAPSPYTTIVYLDGKPSSEEMDFRYKTSNGNVRSIHYESNWTDVYILNPKSSDCQIAAITLLMSQKGIGLRELLEFWELLNSADYSKNGKLTYENIQLSWSVITENCKVTANLITKDDDTRPSYAGLVYDIELCGE